MLRNAFFTAENYRASLDHVRILCLLDHEPVFTDASPVSTRRQSNWASHHRKWFLLKCLWAVQLSTYANVKFLLPLALTLF